MNFDLYKYNIKDNENIIVGCSAGPDSMALLNLLIKYKDVNIIVSHVNYNVRKEADEECEFLKSFCNKNNLIFESIKVDNYSNENFENQARKIRYDFYKRLCKKYKCNKIFLGHHADDLIETILMKIVRGSNLVGYAGFKEFYEVDGYYIIRPLIKYTKDDIVNYNNKNNIKYFYDFTNNSELYTRNRYRKNIVPLLKKENKNLHIKFLKYSKTLIEADNYIKKELDKAVFRCFENKKINIKSFELEDDFIQKKILYYYLNSYYKDDLSFVGDKHINLILDIIYSNKTNIIIDLPNNIQAIKEYNFLYLDKKNNDFKNYEYVLEDEVKLLNGMIIKKIDDIENNSNFVCRLNSKEIKLPIIIRNKKDGDIIYIKGLNGSKKIKDIFIDEKVDIRRRNSYPVVIDSDNNVLWLPGLKKSIFDKQKNEIYDIILKCE